MSATVAATNSLRMRQPLPYLDAARNVTTARLLVLYLSSTSMATREDDDEEGTDEEDNDEEDTGEE